MSPGQTFERVYRELRRQLREGTRPPDTPLEPTAIGDQVGPSFTPVRDALHRLVGEGLVENPKHNGFAVPYLTEQALRDLYAWNGQALTIIGSVLAFPVRGPEAFEPDADTADRSARFFQHFAQETGNREHTKLISTLNDRLGPYRRMEDRFLPNGLDELEALRTAESRRAFGRTMASYHQRRIAYARLVDEWVTGGGLMRSEYGTHSLRRTKASIIYRAIGNLRAVQILLGHSKIENTVRYLGIDVEDALALAENTEI